jgi:diguanylate cyclase (GGDEF)-like protein
LIVWLPILWVAAGICLFAGVHFLNARHSQESAWLYPAFGALCLVVSAYIALSALMQMPSGMRSWDWLERLHVAAACLIFPTAIWFMSLYSRLRVWRAWVIAGFAVFGALLLLDIAGSEGLLVADFHLGAPLVLPWGERVNAFTSTPATFASAYYVATLAVFCWAFWRCWALWAQGEARRAWPLAIYLVLQAFATAWSEYATVYARPGLDWDALPFLALVLLLSRTLTHELRSYDRALRESNAALLKENVRRAQVEDRLRDMAYHDIASKLPNRNGLDDWLAKVLAARPRPPGALVVVDPERFGVINSALGHRVGDLLIQEIGERLSSVAGEAGYVARLNGDEFAVVLIFSGFAGETIEDQIRMRAKALRNALAAPSRLAGQPLSLSVNMGLALLDGQNGDELLREAYAALQVAKQAGQREPVIFAGSMQADAERKLRLEADLRAAIRNDTLQLVYQAQVDRQGALVGAEALLRWNHPEHGPIGPTEFVRIAETSGQMSALGTWVIRKAFAALALLPATEGFRLSVNISPWQLFLGDFLDTILTAIRDSNVDPKRITLEITETAFIHDIRDAAAKIRALDAVGIRVSIDDFGTGYASIASLKAFLVHELKIDQSFIHDMSTDQPDRFVAAMIALGRALDLHVVAEGVEHAAQREALLRMGCDAFQGYLIGRPMAADELARQLRHVAAGVTVS